MSVVNSYPHNSNRTNETYKTLQHLLTAIILVVITSLFMYQNDLYLLNARIMRAFILIFLLQTQIFKLLYIPMDLCSSDLCSSIVVYDQCVLGRKHPDRTTSMGFWLPYLHTHLFSSGHKWTKNAWAVTYWLMSKDKALEKEWVTFLTSLVWSTTHRQRKTYLWGFCPEYTQWSDASQEQQLCPNFIHINFLTMHCTNLLGTCFWF